MSAATKLQTIVFAILLALLEASCSDNPALRSTSSHSANPSPSTSAPFFGEPPSTCEPTQALVHVSDKYPAANGGRPVWFVALADPGPVMRVPYQGNVYTSHGWYRKVLWTIEPGFAEHVFITGFARATKTPLWFQAADKPATTRMELDPKHPGHPIDSTGGWSETGSYVFIPKADCYSFHADWSGGSWSVTFAAGREES